VSEPRAGSAFPHRRPPRPGLDAPVALALVAAPAAVAASFTRLLAGGWDGPLFAALFVLLLVGLRPAVWAVRAGMQPTDSRRRVLYLERRDYSANTALVTMALTGLAIMDVFRLPGAPHWTNQPSAGLVLAAIAVYLVWLSTHASVPDEVKRGWARLMGRKDGR